MAEGHGVPLPPGYVLVERLGSGGFATVWLAEQGRLGRRVAVKVLGETLADDERERRFLAECRAIGRLSGHPAVVTVHDAGTTEAGHPYLVMEHLPGGSLHDRVAQGPLPWTEVLAIGVSVADALAAAHDAGILHRDVKPANVLLDADGAPKLGDFGIARLSEGANTATGTLVGTISFTPPEVLSGHRPGPTADLWSLGATLHTLLTGTSPFAGDRDEPPAATIARVLRSEPAPLPPAVPEDLRALVGDMLAAQPEARPPSATEVVRRLRGIQAARGLAVTPAQATRTDPPVLAPPPDGAATVIGPAPVPTPPPTPPATLVPPPVAGAGTTTVLPGAGPALPPPGPPPGVAAPRPPSGGRGSKAVLAGVAVVVVLVVAAIGVTLALGGGGDDGPDPDTPAGPTSSEREGEEDPGAASAAADTRWGAAVPVPAGALTAPSEAWRLDQPCPDTASCALGVVEGDLLLVRRDDGGNLTLGRYAAADGTERYSVALEVRGEDPGLGWAGGLLVVATSDGGRRTYRAIDPADGTMRWSAQAADAEGPTFPNPQASETHVVLVLGRVGSYVTLAVGPGSERRDDGLVLATDADTVYVAVGDAVVARDLATGDQRWSTPGLSTALPPDRALPFRHGVALDGTIAVVTAGQELVGLDRDGGQERWRVPLSGDGTEVGPALAVTRAGGRVVVLAAQGDLGVDPATGQVAWREARDRLTLDPDRDRDLMASAQGTSIWTGAGDRMAMGWAGLRLRILDTGSGAVIDDDELPPTGGRRGYSPFAEGVAILSGDRVSARAFSDGRVLWNVGAGNARLVTAIDGGVVLAGPDGVQALREG